MLWNLVFTAQGEASAGFKEESTQALGCKKDHIGAVWKLILGEDWETSLEALVLETGDQQREPQKQWKRRERLKGYLRELFNYQNGKQERNISF